MILIVSLLISGAASAIGYSMSRTDARGDVPNSAVDILEGSTKRSGNEIVFNIEVAGNIKESSGNKNYNYMVYITEEKKQTENIYVTYSDGSATWIDYTGDSMSSGPADHSISGGTLEMRVSETLFSNMTDFNFWAYATYSNSETGETFADYLRSWDGTDTNGPSPDDILEDIWTGSMLCIAVGVLIPLIIVVLVIIIVIYLVGEDESQQPPPPEDSSREPPAPPKEGDEGESR